MKGAHVTLPVCIKNTAADNWGVGGKSTPLWLLWRPGKGHVLALRPALILACLFFLYQVSLLYLVWVSLWQKDQGATSEELKLQTTFSKNNKGRGKKSDLWVEAGAKWTSMRGDIVEVKVTWAHHSHLAEGETEAQGSPSREEYCCPGIFLGP